MSEQEKRLNRFLSSHAKETLALGPGAWKTRRQGFLGLEPRVLRHEPGALSHEPLTIKNQLVDALGDYILYVLHGLDCAIHISGLLLILFQEINGIIGEGFVFSVI